MGYIDKMCYELASRIINEMFYPKYVLTIVEGKPWYDNLNNFIEDEWELCKNMDDIQKVFSYDEERAIICDSMQVLCKNMNISDYEWENYDMCIEWDKYEGIISNYMCRLETKMYGKDGKELKHNEIHDL